MTKFQKKKCLEAAEQKTSKLLVVVCCCKTVAAFGFLGSAFASPIAWIMADAFLIPAFFYVYKKLSRQMGTDFEN